MQEYILKNVKEIFMNTQIIIFIATIAAFAVLGFMMSRSIKNYEENAMKKKKKKGKAKYMQEAKRPGRG